MKKYFVALLTFFLPSFLLRLLGRVMGIQLKKGARIGFSMLVANKIELQEGARIGHFNLISVRNMQLGKDAQIGKFNQLNAPSLDIKVHPSGAIGDHNRIYRGNPPVTYGPAMLEIGIFSKITFKHYVDCTRSIHIGNYSILAGLGTQIWTHGYFHAEEGIDRVRIDGEVIIGNNVNISSACVINPGITISDGITVGSNVCVSKSLLEKGMYVSQGLRYIKRDINNVRSNYKRVEGFTLIEEVYVRH